MKLVKWRYTERPRGTSPHLFRGYLTIEAMIAELSAQPAWDEAAAWCRDQFGPADGVRWWRSRNGQDIEFTDEAEAFAFRVRWC